MQKLWFAILLSPLIIAGCAPAPAAIVQPKPPEVKVCLPVTKTITDYEDFTGRTEAVATVDIRARATGYLEKVLFSDGAMVKKGAKLFEIDARPYEAELLREESTLSQRQAELTRVDADFRRAASLLPQRAISREVYDKAAADRNEAEAGVGAARASLQLAKLNLEYTTVAAPLTGRVSRRMVDPGNLVKADETLLTSIVAMDPMYISFDVDERTVLRLHRLTDKGQIELADDKVPIRFALADEDGFPHEGQLDFLDNKVDVGTGTQRMRGVFKNPDQFFAPGLFVRVRLFVGYPHSALMVPERAIGTDQGQKFVFVVNEKSEVVSRLVKIGPLSDGLRVVEKGVAANERVVVNGLQRIRTGSKVVPNLVPAEEKQ